MRPLVICLAYTSTVIFIAGCSSTGSVARPFKGGGGVASSAKGFNEYDQDPPTQYNSPRMASEPSPVPPARGISLSRTIEATATGFCLRKGCTDSCTDDGCIQQDCPSQGCDSKPSKVDRIGTHLNRIFDGRRLARFKSVFRRPCTAVESCASEGCTSCPAQEMQMQTKECLSESHPRMAPPLGERQDTYDHGHSGHSLQKEQPATAPAEDPMAPGKVPDVPVDRISQNRTAAPPAWHQQPLFPATEDARQVHTGHEGLPIQLEPPVWSPDSKQGMSPFAETGLLTPSASGLKTPASVNIPDEDFQITIQPLARVLDPKPSARH